MPFDVNDQTAILARTAWGENRSGGAPGMQSVINAIMNRVKHPGWWGGSIRTVCLCPEQFSSWNANDPNRPKMLDVTVADTDFAIAMRLAEQAVAGTLADITGGADSYYAVSMPEPPFWAATATFTVEIAGQRFYKTV
jgi:hypothetical protein